MQATQKVLASFGSKTKLFTMPLIDTTAGVADVFVQCAPPSVEKKTPTPPMLV